MPIPVTNDGELDARRAARQEAKQRAADRLLAKLARFDRLPDAAIIDDHAAATLLNMSVFTLRRTNPVPRYKTSRFRFGRRAGDLRKFIQDSAQGSAA